MRRQPAARSALFGAGLGRIFDAGAEVSLKDVFSPTLIAALIGLGVLSLLPGCASDAPNRRIDERNDVDVTVSAPTTSLNLF